MSFTFWIFIFLATFGALFASGSTLDKKKSSKKKYDKKRKNRV